MITQHGVRCDACGDYILLDTSVNPFRCKGISQQLHSHDKCKPALVDAMTAKDWKRLPNGPLRAVFEDAEKEVKP